MDRTKRYLKGQASNYIVHFKKLISIGRCLKVVLYCRVSRCQQNKNGNLKAQKKYLLKIIRWYRKKYNIKIHIVAIFEEVASGWRNDRTILEKAALMARDYNAVLVAESSCRFLRNRSYHSSDSPEALPNNREYYNLIKDTLDVTLATILPPNWPWKRVRTYQTKRGQRSKRKFGGRPKKSSPGYKKRRKEKWLPHVLRLYHKKHYKIAKIKRVLEKNTGERFAWTTISDWVKNHGFFWIVIL